MRRAACGSATPTGGSRSWTATACGSSTTATASPSATSARSASRGDHVWVGGERGLLRFDGEHFVPVRTSGEDALREIWGVVETEAGELWVAGSAGIVRLSRDQLAAGPARSGSDAEADDLRLSRWTDRQRSVDAAHAGDGRRRRWAAVVRALDRPGRHRSRAHREEYLAAAGDHLVAHRSRSRILAVRARSLCCPCGTRQLQIGYAASSLAVPERVRFPLSARRARRHAGRTSPIAAKPFTPTWRRALTGSA